ncbi:MAG TPA: FKBP-type peptidyl-prolyl cis-trans isomerase [Bacteroidota bacterium]|nr:FKBP-type peptidyl-prolyl cis-trans isomerase [Bacteroidota bacterium]
MVNRILGIGLTVLAVIVGALAQGSTPALKTQKEKFSYSVGLDIGRNMVQRAEDIDADVLVRGIRDALSGATPLLTDQQIEETMKQYQAEMMEKQGVAAERNKKTGEAFLAENKKKEGVVTLPSGLQYKILKAGSGPKPTAGQSVECNYRGTLIDGKEFDSSYKRGQTITFPLTNVIKGWSEALQLMPVGSKWQLFVPSDLAYGDRGAGNDIEPGATLIFEVELVSIK